MATLRRNTRRRKAEEQPPQAMHKIKLLIIVVDRGQAIRYLRENEKHDVTTQLVLLGHGTASLTLDYLGLGDIKKDVVLSIVKEEKCDEILEALSNRLAHGKGVAFTVSISSMIGVSLYQFLTNAPIEH